MLSITGLWKINVTGSLPETSLVESRRDQGNPHMSEFGLFSCVYVRGGQRVDCDLSQMELVGSRLKQEQARMGATELTGSFPWEEESPGLSGHNAKGLRDPVPDRKVLSWNIELWVCFNTGEIHEMVECLGVRQTVWYDSGRPVYGP